MIIVSDNLQITNPLINSAVDQMNPEPIKKLVNIYVTAGAEAIDINSGPLTRSPEDKMAFLVKTVQSVTDLPLLLDTSNSKALEAGLIESRNHTIINGFSLEPKKLISILPLAKKYNTDIIGYLLYPNSRVPIDETDCMNTALDLYLEFQKADIDDARLIIDPVIAPFIWEYGNHHNRAILSVIKNLPDLLGFPVRTIAGLSNLSSGNIPLERKRLLEQSFLPMLSASGLTLALLNVFHAETMSVARVCKSLLSPEVFSWV